MRRLTIQPDQLGDGPVWDGAANKLYWLDIVGKRLSNCNEDGTGLERHPLPETPGSHAARQAGGRLMAFRRRIVLFDADGHEEAAIDVAGVDLTRERFNDGLCDSHGRFWVGTMDRYLREPVGALYCIRPDRSAVRMASGFGISNGIAFSPGFDRLYQCDSLFPQIFSYDFDVHRGLIGEREIFARFTADMGVPDGCAMDVQGNLWVATPGVNRVVCFDPRGRLCDSIETPTAWPSSVAFGGRTRHTLFITSLQPREESTSPTSRAETRSSTVPLDQSADGLVYATPSAIAGIEQHRFGG